MKNIAIIFSVVFAGILFFTACNNDDCVKMWHIEGQANGVIIEINTDAKELSLQGYDFAGFGGEIFQQYFTGDFEAIANFKNFAAGSGGRTYALMMMYNSEIPDTILDTTIVYCGITRNYIYSGIGLNWTSGKNTNGNTGVFRIKKFGNNLLAQTIVGTDTAQVAQNYAVNPIRFGFRIGTMGDSVVTGISGIKITKFQVIGSNNVTLLGDEFTCNSIQP